MFPLPALSVDFRHWTVPVSDRSGAALIEALLAGNSPQSIAALAQALAVDPPLAIWATCSARRRSGVTPRSLADLASWLIDHGLAVLDWSQSDAAALSAPTPAVLQRFAELVERDLQVAELAALAAMPDGPAVAEEARWAGLVHHARQWLTIGMDSGESSEGGDSGALSSAATEILECFNLTDHRPAADYVQQAVDFLAGQAQAEALRDDLAACQQRAIAGRNRWMEKVPLASHLPVLLEKLRRLEQLEGHFQEVLEAEKLDAMAEFAAGAGHEINNPLAVIGGRAQLFLRHETDPERRRELALMNAQVKRAYEMIADMRLFARPPKPEFQTIDLAALVDHVMADLASLAADRAVALGRTGELGQLEVEADPVQIHVALRALCTNSLEAIGHDGHVGLAIHRAGENVQIQVIDDGPGILPEHRRHIFDPFFSARQAGRGLGLGLSKCWRIVTGHHGRIEVESQPGRGATFTITLPCRQRQD